MCLVLILPLELRSVDSIGIILLRLQPQEYISGPQNRCNEFHYVHQAVTVGVLERNCVPSALWFAIVAWNVSQPLVGASGNITPPSIHLPPFLCGLMSVHCASYDATITSVNVCRP
jgi:hypothetical protein